jgi:hypothetical protein
MKFTIFNFNHSVKMQCFLNEECVFPKFSEFQKKEKRKNESEPHPTLQPQLKCLHRLERQLSAENNLAHKTYILTLLKLLTVLRIKHTV